MSNPIDQHVHSETSSYAALCVCTETHVHGKVIFVADVNPEVAWALNVALEVGRGALVTKTEREGRRGLNASRVSAHDHAHRPSPKMKK